MKNEEFDTDYHGLTRIKEVDAPGSSSDSLQRLPEGWEFKAIGEIIRLEYGKPLDDSLRTKNGLYPVYGANGIKARTNEFYHDTPSIIVGRKGSAGEVNLTCEKFWPLDVTYFVIFDIEKYDRLFLYYLLLSLNLQKLAKGVKPGINRNEVYSIRTLIPPLPEQKRIVSILNEAFTVIDKAKANAEKNLVNAKELFEKYLNGLYGNPSDAWEKKKLGEICEIKHGFAFAGEFFSTTGEYILLTPGNLYEKGGYRDRGEKQKYYIGDIPKEYILNKGDLLIAMTEQAHGLLGSSMIVPENYKFLHNQRLGLVKPTNGIRWNTEFISYLFNTSYIRDEIESTASGVKVRHTSPQKIYNIEVIIPSSLMIQQKIVNKLNLLLKETKHLESIYRKKITALDELTKSILKKAFEGEL